MDLTTFAKFLPASRGINWQSFIALHTDIYDKMRFGGFKAANPSFYYYTVMLQFI